MPSFCLENWSSVLLSNLITVAFTATVAENEVDKGIRLFLPLKVSICLHFKSFMVSPFFEVFPRKFSLFILCFALFIQSVAIWQICEDAGMSCFKFFTRIILACIFEFFFQNVILENYLLECGDPVPSLMPGTQYGESVDYQAIDASYFSPQFS